MEPRSDSPVSVVLPVRDAEETIERALEAVFASTSPPREVVVVDDGCTDGTIDIARRFPVRIERSGDPGGVAAARNAGAAKTSGPILFFLDADVVIERRALEAAERVLDDPSISVAIGLQSARAAFPNPPTAYKNLWLRYTYEKKADRISVLYSSAVAIRREVFDEVGGFDVNYRKPNIEDSELGKRITDAGHRMAVVPEVGFLHIKRYTVGGMARTDFHRTAGMTKVQLRDRFRRIRRENYSSIPTSFLISCLAPWFAAAAYAAGESDLAFPGASLLVILLNFFWLRALRQHEGRRAALLGILFLHLDVAAVNLGAAWGFLEYLGGERY
ncbi:MAG: glycosyltransferase family A protein [Candidatus Eisenbacteria bacterium]